MGRPIEPRQRRNLLQEGQIPVRTSLRLSVALAPIFIQFGLGLFLGFRLINVGVPSTPESIFNAGFSWMCVNVTWPHCEAVYKRISAFAGLCECSTVEG